MAWVGKIFIKIALFLDKSQDSVNNDVAERVVKMDVDYANIMTKDEENN